ncbi:MAG: response regulator [Butyrivibrio sp.]|nr:response regulator [Butyrivibrio sp.]
MNILVVDDERSAIKDLVRIIKRVEPNANIQTSETSDEAVDLCGQIAFDVAFLDINMPDRNGLSLAKELKEIRPMINIIIVTAYPKYAVDAFKLWASGYLLKPAMDDDVRDALNNLRNPVGDSVDGVHVQCFGNFEIFCNGEAVKFGRSKSKEMLAYLVDRRGSSASNAEIRAVLWEDDAVDEDKQRKYFAQIVHDLKNSLEKACCEYIFVQSRDSYAVDTTKFSCDYYMAINKDPKAMAEFTGEYMSQYNWSYKRVGYISKEIEK